MRRWIPGSYPSRTACSVLSEMRECLAALQLAPLKGLIEELQMICNRMEAGLEDAKDLEALHKEKKKLRAEVKELQKQLPEKEDKD